MDAFGAGPGCQGRMKQHIHSIVLRPQCQPPSHLCSMRCGERRRRLSYTTGHRNRHSLPQILLRWSLSRPPLNAEQPGLSTSLPRGPVNLKLYLKGFRQAGHVDSDRMGMRPGCQLIGVKRVLAIRPFQWAHSRVCQLVDSIEASTQVAEMCLSHSATGP